MFHAVDFSSLPCERIDCSRSHTEALKACFGHVNAAKRDSNLASTEEMLEARRKAITATKAEGNDNFREILTNYYRLLDSLGEKLPKKTRTKPSSWLSRYSSNSHQLETECIRYEMAITLFNLAAFLSQKALEERSRHQTTRSNDAKLFQEAAAVVARLRKQNLNIGKPRSKCLDGDFLMMAENLLLAQAQERVVWNAIVDAKNASVIAKCAKGASKLNELASHSSRVQSKKQKPSWNDTVKTKHLFFEAICQYYWTKREANETIGQKIARLQHSCTLLRKLRKNTAVSRPLRVHVEHYLKLTTTALDKAEVENRNVYLMRIPGFHELEDVETYMVENKGDCSFLDRERLVQPPIDTSPARGKKHAKQRVHTSDKNRTRKASTQDASHITSDSNQHLVGPPLNAPSTSYKLVAQQQNALLSRPETNGMNNQIRPAHDFPCSHLSVICFAILLHMVSYNAWLVDSIP